MINAPLRQQLVDLPVLEHLPCWCREIDSTRVFPASHNRVAWEQISQHELRVGGMKSSYIEARHAS